MTFAVNHLAPFLLTNLLLDRMKASVPAHIINISSSLERIGNLNFDDLQGEKRYISIGAYAQAKLATMLFSYELARRVEGDRSNGQRRHSWASGNRFWKEWESPYEYSSSPLVSLCHTCGKRCANGYLPCIFACICRHEWEGLLSPKRTSLVS